MNEMSRRKCKNEEPQGPNFPFEDAIIQKSHILDAQTHEVHSKKNSHEVHVH
jgi:hypothetical protein